MVIEEILNERLVHHYSDKGLKILQVETGMVYDDAIDTLPCQYTYEETNEPTEQDELVDAINALRILGVE